MANKKIDLRPHYPFAYCSESMEFGSKQLLYYSRKDKALHDDDSFYCPDPKGWTDEDSWDAMTDGQYGDYPGSGWDPEHFGY